MAKISTINGEGDITLGKEYAGKRVLIDEIEPGVWMIKSGSFIPDNEHWLHEPDTKKKIDEAIEWAKNNPPTESDLLEEIQ